MLSQELIKRHLSFNIYYSPTFINLFLIFYLRSQKMKNPFLDTAKYTVVKQFNRLASKKRSVSQTGPRTFKSPHSFHVYHKDHHFTDPLHFSSGNYDRYNINRGNEYQLQPEFRKSCIEKKRTSILNYDQFRYRPYSFTNSSNFFSSSISDRFQYYGIGPSMELQLQGKINSLKNYEVEKNSSSIKEDKTGDQKDYKQKDEVLNALQQNIENYSQQMDQYYNRIIFSPESIPKQKRESSIAGTMLRINTNAKNKMKNYEYTSMNDADPEQNNKCNQNINKNKRLNCKKPSIFQEFKSIKKLTPQYQKQNKQEYNYKNKEKQKKISRSILSELEVSQKQVQGCSDYGGLLNKYQCYEQKQKPPLIEIRGQVFYLQQNIKKKY